MVYIVYFSAHHHNPWERGSKEADESQEEDGEDGERREAHGLLHEIHNVKRGTTPRTSWLCSAHQGKYWQKSQELLFTLGQYNVLSDSNALELIWYKSCAFETHFCKQNRLIPMYMNQGSSFSKENPHHFPLAQVSMQALYPICKLKSVNKLFWIITGLLCWCMLTRCQKTKKLNKKQRSNGYFTIPR